MTIEKQSNIDNMYEHIFDAYQNTNRFAICLLELNEKEIKRFKNNCIHCDGLSKVNNQVIYEKITYGWNIRVRRKEGENRIIPKVMKKIFLHYYQQRRMFRNIFKYKICE